MQYSDLTQAQIDNYYKAVKEALESGWEASALIRNTIAKLMILGNDIDALRVSDLMLGLSALDNINNNLGNILARKNNNTADNMKFNN